MERWVCFFLSYVTLCVFSRYMCPTQCSSYKKMYVWLFVCLCASVTNQPASCQTLSRRVCLCESVFSSLPLLSAQPAFTFSEWGEKKKLVLTFRRGHQKQSIIMKLNGLLRSVLTEGWLLLIGVVMNSGACEWFHSSSLPLSHWSQERTAYHCNTGVVHAKTDKTKISA